MSAAGQVEGKAVAGPLAGLKVLELGQLIAGPFAAKTLAAHHAGLIAARDCYYFDGYPRFIDKRQSPFFID